MRFPTWVDLKGEDAVPETVHHSVVMVDPRVDRSWSDAPKQKRIATDGVHDQDRVQTASETPGPSTSHNYTLTGFYRVLLCFPGFYRVLMGFTRFYWVLRDLNGFYRV